MIKIPLPSPQLSQFFLSLKVLLPLPHFCKQTSAQPFQPFSKAAGVPVPKWLQKINHRTDILTIRYGKKVLHSLNLFSIWKAWKAISLKSYLLISTRSHWHLTASVSVAAQNKKLKEITFFIKFEK